MMYRSQEVPDTNLPYDLCIVGSGPSGMSICTELSDTDLRICILESGAVEPSAFADRLRMLELEGIAIRENSRERVLGGSSHTWGGTSALYDTIDYESRPGSPWHIGWPFRAEVMKPFLERAAARYRFPSPDQFASEEKVFSRPGSPAWKHLRPKVFLGEHARLHFGREYRYIFENKNIDLITDATVSELRADKRQETGRVEVHEAVCRDHTSKTFRVRARAFVLAAGAVENARILLNSTETSPAGIGNEYDQVGRYLMNHPKGYRGRIRLARAFPAAEEYFKHRYGNLVGYVVLTLSEGVQRSKNILNSGVQLMPFFPWTNRRELFLLSSFIRTMRRIAAAALRYDLPAAYKEILELVRLLPLILAAFPVIAVLTLARITRGRNPKPQELQMRFFLEMEPHPENRVTIGSTPDPLGIPVAHVRHALTERDIESWRELYRTVGEECRQLGVGELFMTDDESRHPPDEDASHHLGTTRMGNDPALSVVNADLRVHTADNLYAAGGSVFPTSGNATPTLLMVALSLRLAEHLRTVLGAHEFHQAEPAHAAYPTLIIGAGERVREEIVPVLESLTEFSITKIYARVPRVLFGKRRVYDVAAFSSLCARDIEEARVLYLSVPPKEVPKVLATLSAYDCSHCDIIMPTLVSDVAPNLRRKFHRLHAEEDCAFLPWIPAVQRALRPEGELGVLRNITFDRSGFRYHAVAMIKTLCGGNGHPGAIVFALRLFNKTWFKCAGGVRAVVVEPRDYSSGRLRIAGEYGIATDRPEPGTLHIECVVEDGVCSGFRVGKEMENLSPEESMLFGLPREGDTIINRMHDVKRVGLRRLIHAIASTGEAWPFDEGVNDGVIDTSVRQSGIWISSR